MPFDWKKLVEEWGHLYNAGTVAFSKDIAKASKDNAEHSSSTASVLSHPKMDTAPVVASLSRLAKTPDMTGMNDKTLKATLDAVAKELKTLGVEIKKYVAVLDAAINGEVKTDAFHKAKVKDKLPDSYRQLKLMKTGLLAIQARAINEHKAFSVSKEQQKIGAKQAAGMQKARDAGDETKAKAIEAEARLKKMLLSLSAGFNSSMAKGAAVIQKVKASPTVATYNAEMNSGGRDIRQNVLNIGLMKNNAGTKDVKQVKALPAPGPLATEIEEFATDTGGLRSLPVTATQADVLRAITKFSALHKRIATTYKALSAVK